MNTLSFKNSIRIIAVLSAFVLAFSACSGSTDPVVFSTSAEPVSTVSPSIPISTIPLSDVTVPATTEAPTQAPTKAEDVDLSKYIALTFDDGPDMRYTSSTNRILDVLEKYGCKATFFVQTIQLTYPDICNKETGQSFAERNKETVLREFNLGMEIGSHSYDHPNFNKMSYDAIQEQINKSCSMIKEVTGQDVKIIRTPGGAEKQSTLDAVGMPIILWDIDTNDWDTKDAQNTYNVVMDKVRGGSIILMHDIYSQTADAVEMIVPELVARGYKLVTVSELFRLYGKEMQPHTRYYHAR